MKTLAEKLLEQDEGRALPCVWDYWITMQGYGDRHTGPSLEHLYRVFRARLLTEMAQTAARKRKKKRDQKNLVW